MQVPGNVPDVSAALHSNAAKSLDQVEKEIVAREQMRDALQGQLDTLYTQRQIIRMTLEAFAKVTGPSYGLAQVDVNTIRRG